MELKNGDCLELMKEIPNNSIDMILCDLPYGTTSCKWDVIIPFDLLWEQYKRIIKENGAIALFSKQPFTSFLIQSNLKWWRYELIWEKEKGTDFGNSNRKPLNAHESIQLFYKKQPTYNKQMRPGEPYVINRKKNNNNNEDLNFKSDNRGLYINKGERTPISVIKISRDNITKGSSFHPTQKPVKLCEWLIKSYTNEEDVVLDNCMGSGSTGIACVNTNREFIGYELNKEYFEIAKKRIEDAKIKLTK